jgi:sulfur relay (sulfurtransferase) DsrC/TusE family protein
MTKERYASIRTRNNFIFNYYLELGGYLRNEQQFEKELNAWLAYRMRTSPELGRLKIIKYLDRKYNYSK